MKTGLSSYTYGWAVESGIVDAFELIRRAREQGFDLLQLGDNIPLDTWSVRELDHLVQIAAAERLELEVGMREMTLPHVLQYVQIARRLQATLLRVVVDGPAYKPDLEQMRDVLRQCRPHLEQHGVTLALENHDRFCAQALADLICAIDSPRIGICLDTANSFGAGEDVDTVVRTLMPLAVNVHLKDFCIRRLPHKQGFVVEGRPLGQGQLPIWKVLCEKKRLCPHVNIILELWTPPEERMEDTIRKEAKWAQESMCFLKEMITHTSCECIDCVV